MPLFLDQSDIRITHALFSLLPLLQKNDTQGFFDMTFILYFALKSYYLETNVFEYRTRNMICCGRHLFGVWVLTSSLAEPCPAQFEVFPTADAPDPNNQLIIKASLMRVWCVEGTEPHDWT